MSGETITKVKKFKIALTERPGNNFYRLCERYKNIDENKIPIEDFIKLHKPMAKAISTIISIMENGHETQPEDIKEIVIVRSNSKKDMEITFKRYRQCKLQPIVFIIDEFKKGVVEIDPSIACPF